MIQKHLAASVLLLLSGLAGAALGQASDADSLDLVKIRAEAAKHASDAQRLSDQVRARADTERQAAIQMQVQAKAHAARHVETVKARQSHDTAKPFDFDRMIAEANSDDREALAESPRFIAFASLSMPPASLKAMLADVPKAGGVVVFRGFPHGDMKLFVGALTKAIGSRDAVGSAGIDPRLFRAFKIDAVPAYVIVSSDFDLCDGFDCATQLPPHDRMTGNVTADYALQTFARGGGPGARIAQAHLDELAKARP